MIRHDGWIVERLNAHRELTPFLCCGRGGQQQELQQAEGDNGTAHPPLWGGESLRPEKPT